MSDQTRPSGDDQDIVEGANSDPTGGGPPPPGSATRVTSDGRGVTQGADIDRGAQPEAGVTRSISTGPNARPRNESISSTAPGLPNDTSGAVEITAEEERAIERKIREL